MTSLQPFLTSLLKSLPPPPAAQDVLNDLIKKTLQDAKDKASPENRKSQWEYLLKNEIFILASKEGQALKDPNTKYYDELRDKLDVVLTFTEHDACEQTFPFIVLQDLLETQTIASCSHIFSWIEARAERLTEGMVPQKGKALILLRTLNDLLRRLSKMGTTTIFCGRILTFLSGVFPLGERSGVNLRGEYGPTWEGVSLGEKTKADDKDVEMEVAKSLEEPESKEGEAQGDKMQVDSKEVKKPVPTEGLAEKKDAFYNTFWALQLPFSKPPLFAADGTFEDFKERVNKVMPVIKEATAKERAMMGSRGVAGTGASLKRKRDLDSEESNSNEYFFAKFLTSPDLLDLEIADTHFRRQFLFQLLILLNHLLTFTKTAKAAWTSTRNRSLQMDFTLEDNEAQWVQESITKVTEELRQTTPNGRIFAETISAILDREKNWVRWKNELCAPFDKEPWFVEQEGKFLDLFDATAPIRAKMREPPEDWKWQLGTEPLTEIWDMGYRDLTDLQNPFQPGDVKDFVKKIKQEDARIELRKRNLTKTAERLALAQARAAAAKAAVTTETKETVPSASTSAETLSAPRPLVGSNQTSSSLHPSLPPKPGSPVKPSLSQDTVRNATPAPAVPVIAIAAPVPAPSPAPTPAPTAALPDEQISKFEENKQRWSWLALRTARDQYLQHFGKIGTGDIELLAQEIEKEKEKPQKGEECSGSVEEQGSGTSGTENGPPGENLGENGMKTDGEGDIKMEER